MKRLLPELGHRVISLRRSNRVNFWTLGWVSRNRLFLIMWLSGTHGARRWT
jgi:hypothetical protein